MTDSDRQEQQNWSSISSQRDRAGEATRMFVTHVNHYFTSLPLISLFTIIIPILINLFDVISLLGPSHEMYLYGWLHLSMTKVIYHFQVYRVLLYPLVHPNTTLLITNLILLIPYVSTHERKKGSLCLLYELAVLYTILPAIVYVLAIGLLTKAASMTGIYLGAANCSGLSVWTVGLSFGSMLDAQAQGDTTHHSLFGVIPLPSKAIPFLIVGFYFFLVPDSSLVLHLSAAGIAYLYFRRRLPSILTPTNEIYKHYENHRLVRFLSNQPKFVSVDTAVSNDGYLPVVSNSSSAPYTVNTQPSSSISGSPSNFPGHGYTLSDN